MKKGLMLSMEYIVSAIIVLLFLIFGSLLIVKIYGSSLSKKSVDIICWDSVRANSEIRTPGISTETRNVICPTKYITFHINGYDEEYEKIEGLSFEKDSKKFKALDGKDCNNEKFSDKERESCIFYNINKKISDEMKSCWFKMHEGKKRVFSQYETETQCVVCANFLFDDEFREEYSDLGYLGQSNPEDPNYNLDLYMKTNLAFIAFDSDQSKNEQDAANQVNDNKISIYDYTSDIMDLNWEPPIYDYQVNDDYAIVFSALNEYFVKDIAGDIWNQWSGRGESENDPNFVNTLQFVPNSQVAVYCGTWG